MTHLETLVRTLPRQRRAFAAQAATGFGMVVCGFALVSLGALQLLGTPKATGWSLYLAICFTILGVYLLLFGGYRATKADLLLHENAALIAAVQRTLEEEYRKGDIEVKIWASSKDMQGEIERALEMAKRDHRRGVR